MFTTLNRHLLPRERVKGSPIVAMVEMNTYWLLILYCFNTEKPIVYFQAHLPNQWQLHGWYTVARWQVSCRISIWITIAYSAKFGMIPFWNGINNVKIALLCIIIPFCILYHYNSILTLSFTCCNALILRNTFTENILYFQVNIKSRYMGWLTIVVHLFTVCTK